MFGGGGSAPTSEQVMEQSKLQASIFIDYFNKAAEACYNKCVVKMTEPDLSVGEMTCIDRCAWKYFEGHANLLQTVQKYEEMMQQQEAAKRQLTGGK